MTLHIPILDFDHLKEKTVLLRVDFNVPLKNGKVMDNSRIRTALPTIKKLLHAKARIIILSHLGRPKGKYDPSLSLKPVYMDLCKLLARTQIMFADTPITSPAFKRSAQSLHPQEILMAENIRFYPEEEKNDPLFAKHLAALGDIYVNDAFSASHRAHASVEALPRLLPHYAGILFQQEVQTLEKLLHTPTHPVIAIVSGAKVSTKLVLLENLIKKMDIIIVGGGIANTFLLAQGHPIGCSLSEPDLVEKCQYILQQARREKCKILLPVDTVVTTGGEKGRDTHNIQTSIINLATSSLQNNYVIMDIGPATIQLICEAIDQCKTLVWNGPLGVVEKEPFENGSYTLAHHIAERTKSHKLISIIGGGDTAAFLQHTKFFHDFSYVSMAGGAFLEWLEGKELPGIKALMSKHPSFS